MSTPSDYARRSTLTDAVLQFFFARPYAWVEVRTLAEVGGFSAWRTRVSEARQRVHADHLGDIEWNNSQRASAYRYVPVVRQAAPTQSVLFEMAVRE